MIYLINAESTATKTNNGMKTVDIAWDLFLKRNNLDLSYKRFSITPEKNIIKVTKKISLDYEPLINFNFNKLSNEDSLIYWGDFLHANNYLSKDLKRLSHIRKKSIKRKIVDFLFKKKKYIKNSKIIEDYIDVAYKYYLLENIIPHWKKTISFGTTLIGDDIVNTNKRYKNVFNEFIQQKVDAILVRDIFSALKIAHIKQNYNKFYLGCDAALFNKWEDYEKILDYNNYLKTFENQKYILIHFTRTKVNINSLLSFVFKVNEKIKYPIYWIPWLVDMENKNFSYIKLKYKRNIQKFKMKDYSSLIYSIKNASLVITDTYHLSLIGWKLHTPVISVGIGAQLPTSTVDDKKKEIFYGMYNISPLYFFGEHLNNKNYVNNFISNIENIIKNKNHNILNDIYNTIDSHSNLVEQKLLQTIKKDKFK